MKDSLTAGITRTARVTVDADRAISFLGDKLRLYATPSMVSDVEYTCLNLLLDHLDEGESSVGIHIAVDHLGATPLGHWVEVTVTVTEVDGRKVSLEAEIRDTMEVVGRGKPSRFVIDVARHAERLKAKAAKLAES